MQLELAGIENRGNYQFGKLPGATNPDSALLEFIDLPYPLVKPG
jgi:hypothetical protein